MLQLYRHCLPACLIGIVLSLVCLPMNGLAADFFLAWNPNSESGLIGYYLYYQEASSVAADPDSAMKVNIPQDAQGFDPDNPGYTLVGLKDDTLYYFAVSAYNAAGESELSDEVSLSKSASGSINPTGTGGSGGSGGCFIGSVQ